MKASETKLEPIIEGTKQYVVPLFQRPYSWDTKEWDVLWEDILFLCQNSEPLSHFIGSIVTMPTTSVPEGVAKYLLIDGQQRLTTIFIILTVLRDAAKQSEDEMLSAEITETLLVNRFKQQSDYFKLLPTQVDRASYQSLILKAKTNDLSQVSRCYEYFDRKLRQSKIDIKVFKEVITSRLSVVSILLERDDNPHLVFESLNAKGRRLTQADLIRNYFFMRVHVDQQERIHSSFWFPMQEALGENLTEFIRHYLIRSGDFIKQSDVYFSLKDRVGQNDALVALQNLATFAQYYRNLANPDFESSLIISSAIKRLNRLEVTTTYPFLLDCYHDYASGILSENDFVRILHLVENFVVRRFVCGIPTSQLNKIFPPLYRQAKSRNPENFVSGVSSVLQLRGYPRDTEFRTRLTDSRLYGAGERATKTKLILESLECSYLHKEQVSFENLTIEHVMPQTLTDWWKHHLGEDWQADHELYVHTLGNLTLTAYNSELSNETFPKKQERLADSHLELNGYFSQLASWQKVDIEARSIKLAKVAIKIWPYFGDNSSTVTASLNNISGSKPISLVIMGQSVPVSTWRDVYVRTLETIADLEPIVFEQLANDYPRFISRDQLKFRRFLVLNNGFYIEINLDAKAIYRFCIQAIGSIGLSSDDWLVETEATN